MPRPQPRVAPPVSPDAFGATNDSHFPSDAASAPADADAASQTLQLANWLTLQAQAAGGLWQESSLDLRRGLFVQDVAPEALGAVLH